MTDIDAIRQREQAATKGPWPLITDACGCNGEYPCGHGDYPIGFGPFDSVEHSGTEQAHADHVFAAHARQDIPALLDLLAIAQQDIRDRYEQIARLERHIAGLETQCNEQMHALAAERDGCPVCKANTTREGA